MSNLSNEKDKIFAAAEQAGADLQSLEDDLLAPVAGGVSARGAELLPQPGQPTETCGGLNEGGSFRPGADLNGGLSGGGSFRPSDGIGVGELNARGKGLNVKR